MYGTDFWIGYHRLNNGTYVWEGEDSSYTNFAIGYPELYNCTRTTAEGLWKDRNCLDFMNYICEKPAGQPFSSLLKKAPKVLD